MDRKKNQKVNSYLTSGSRSLIEFEGSKKASTNKKEKINFHLNSRREVLSAKAKRNNDMLPTKNYSGLTYLNTTEEKSRFLSGNKSDLPLTKLLEDYYEETSKMSFLKESRTENYGRLNQTFSYKIDSKIPRSFNFMKKNDTSQIGRVEYDEM